jgi:hypothetical protein
MSKAKLVTRSETTSTVTDDNLGKAAALTHAEMDSNLINLRDASWGLADDGSTVLTVTNDKTITIAGGAGISTALSGDTLTITASESQNVFNTIAVAGQSNIVADATTDTLTVAAGTGISITTDAGTDTLTITNTATAGTITALNNQAENRLTTIGATTTELDGEANLTFDGSTLTLTGTAALDGVTITDNTISTNASNANLELSANGSGYISLGPDFDTVNSNTRYNYGTTRVYNGTISGTNRVHQNCDGGTITATGNLSSGATVRQEVRNVLDMDGYDSTATNTPKSRGLNVMAFNGFLKNGAAAASTVEESSAFVPQVTVDAAGGDITVTHLIAVNAGLLQLAQSGLTSTITNGYGVYSNGVTDDGGAGTKTTTNYYHFFAAGSSVTPTNQYAFYSNDDDLLNRAGKFERYREKINALTSDTTITTDCALAPVHTVTLAGNTQFVITNLGTGQTVTLIITQDGTGSRTASFGTDGSTAVKFPGGAPTLSTAASAIDVVTIFNDGTNYLGNIAQAYA